MPQPRFRSRTYRRVKRKLPSGKTVMHYEKRKPDAHACAKCGMELKGTPKEMPYKIKNMGISNKRPKRPYGGYLCSECSRIQIKKEARA